MIDVLSLSLLSLGAFFTLIGAIGIVRMPDLFLRMSTTTKSTTFGAGLMLLGVAVYFGETGITTRVLATIAFLFLTAPVAAHMIGRAAYTAGTSLWKNTVHDEWSSVKRSGEVDGSSRDRISSDFE